MKRSSIIIILILISCSCLILYPLIDKSGYNNSASFLPTTIGSLIITNEISGDSITVNLDEPKERLLRVLDQAEKTKEPKSFEPCISLGVNNEILYISKDIFQIDSTFYYKENMEDIWARYFSDIKFKYQNSVEGIRTQVDAIQLQWLGRGQIPYISVERNSINFIDAVVDELLKLDVTGTNSGFPKHSEMMLKSNNKPLLEYNFNTGIKIDGSVYRVSDLLDLTMLLWDSEEVVHLMESKIREALTSDGVSCQLRIDGGEWQIVKPEESKRIADYFKIYRHMYGGYLRYDDIARFELKFNCGSIADMQLEIFSADMLEVNSMHFFIKYNSDLWDYLSKVYPAN